MKEDPYTPYSYAHRPVLETHELREVTLVEKAIHGWRRRSCEVADRDGRIYKLRIGYEHPTMTDATVIALSPRQPFTSADYERLGSRLFESIEYKTGFLSEDGEDVQESFRIKDNFWAGTHTSVITAPTKQLLEFATRLVHGHDYHFTGGEAELQGLWDEFIRRAFAASRGQGYVVPEDREKMFAPSWATRSMVGLPGSCKVVDPEEYASIRSAEPGSRIQALVASPDAAERSKELREDWDRWLGDYDARVRLRKEAVDRRYKRRYLSEPSDARADAPEAFAFSRTVGGGLTNGPVTLPPRRPHGTEWGTVHQDARPLQRVESSAWPELLDTLEGAFHRDLGDVPARLKVLAQDRRRQKREQTLAHKVAGQCIQLGLLMSVEKVDVSFGERLLIEGTKSDRAKVFIVDSPNYGVGLYVFKNRADAVAWASGRIEVREARTLATRFIPHTKNWEEHARNTLTGSSTDQDE